METFGQGKPKEGQKEKIAEIRKKIAKYEAMDDEARVLELEAELRALEKGEEFDREKYLEKTETPEPPYEYFQGDGSVENKFRKDIFIYSKGMTEYIRENAVRNVVFMDRAARPAWVGIDEYWEQKFKDKPKPGFYFINSDNFMTDEFVWDGWDEGVVRDKNRVSDRLSDEEVLEQLTSKYKSLLKFKNEPILLFDTCSHSGDTLSSVKRIFEQAGFTDVRTVTATEPDPESGVESVITFNDSGMELCLPFGSERSIMENWRDISSARGNKKGIEAGRAMRNDIRKIIREYLK